MTSSPELPSRRDELRFAAALVLARTASAWALAANPAPAHSVTVAQVIDTWHEQQDVSTDLLIGARTPWQGINAKVGLKGRPVQHQSVAVGGSD